MLPARTMTLEFKTSLKRPKSRSKSIILHFEGIQTTAMLELASSQHYPPAPFAKELRALGRVFGLP